MVNRSFPRTLACSLAAGLVGAAQAIAASPAAEAQARFRADMAVCNSGQSNQDAATCRTEARNALAQARRGDLTSAPGQYVPNAMQRCSALKEADRSDCAARVRGEGTASGSVAGGGILRETVTVVPAK